MRMGPTWTVGAALTASFALHFSGFMMVPEQEIKIAGGVTQQLAMLGNSFADVSAGTTSPVDPKETTEVVDDADPLDTVPQPPEVSQPVTTPDQIETPAPQTSALAVVENRSNPVVPLLTTTTALPDTKAALVPAKPLETITAEAPVEVQQAKPETRRPVTRPAKPVATPAEAPAKPVATRAKPTAPRRTQTATAAPKPQGGQAAQRGQADGSNAGQAASSSRQGTRAVAAGNAAASNYAGLVHRKIGRARRSVRYRGQRGTARVWFKISPNGALASVGISKSSGLAKIDSLAIRIVQRAAPFPRPPKGARRSFRIPIEVRR